MLLKLELDRGALSWLIAFAFAFTAELVDTTGVDDERSRCLRFVNRYPGVLASMGDKWDWLM